jgi:probable addiction module antidote protein
MKEAFTPFDVATLLEDEEAFEFFMNDALETDDSGYIAHAIGVVARAKGMTKVADETGLAREALYRSFSEDGNPSLKSTIAVLKSLGFGLAVRPISAEPLAIPGEAAE